MNKDDKKVEITKRIGELANLINKHNHHYHTKDKPIIDDWVYDNLVKENSKLETEQLSWDQNTQYFFSEKAFTLSTLKDTIYGVGFECKEDLSRHLAKKTIGKLETTEE